MLYNRTLTDGPVDYTVVISNWKYKRDLRVRPQIFALKFLISFSGKIKQI